jgi:hypothetical protein
MSSQRQKIMTLACNFWFSGLAISLENVASASIQSA